MSVKLGQKEVSFKGFREKDRDLRAFKFAEPTLSDQHATGDAVSSVGVICVKVERRKLTGASQIPLAGCYEAPQSAELKEAKKFWQQPSLETEAGRHTTNGLGAFSPLLYVTIATFPSLELRYHTKAMADILDGINNPTYPTMPTMPTMPTIPPAMGLSADIGAEDEDEEGGESGASSGRKRRRTSNSGSSGGTLAAPIDLTGPYTCAPTTRTGPAIMVDLMGTGTGVKAEKSVSVGARNSSSSSSSSSSDSVEILE
jgi:hypothetical protein